MKKLIIIDMQNDFITGSLANPDAEKIIPNIIEKMKEYNEKDIIYTLDTHYGDYLKTNEGKHLPIMHCMSGTWGNKIDVNLRPSSTSESVLLHKNTFGTLNLGRMFEDYNDSELELTLVGTCTDICVISNALILKAQLPEAKIIVDASCCAGLTPEKHKAALEVMKSCQIEVVNE